MQTIQQYNASRLVCEARGGGCRYINETLYSISSAALTSLIGDEYIAGQLELGVSFIYDVAQGGGFACEQAVEAGAAIGQVIGMLLPFLAPEIGEAVVIAEMACEISAAISSVSSTISSGLSVASSLINNPTALIASGLSLASARASASATPKNKMARAIEAPVAVAPGPTPSWTTQPIVTSFALGGS